MLFTNKSPLKSHSLIMLNYNVKMQETVFLFVNKLVTLSWPESHRSEFEIDRLLVIRALVGECFDLTEV